MAVIQRTNGVRSRAAILERGLRLTEAGGLHTATIGTLADALGMSKSGVFAHFGSKEALDEALVDAAAARFEAEVLRPADAAPPGIARVAALCEAALAGVTRPVAGGGPLLTPGHPALRLAPATAARARLDGWRQAWHTALAAAIADGMARGELAPGLDPAQIVFELDALLEAAGRAWRDAPADAVVARARRAVDRVLLA